MSKNRLICQLVTSYSDHMKQNNVGIRTCPQGCFNTVFVMGLYFGVDNHSNSESNRNLFCKNSKSVLLFF